MVDCGGLENRCTARYPGFESNTQIYILLNVNLGVFFLTFNKHQHIIILINFFEKDQTNTVYKHFNSKIKDFNHQFNRIKDKTSLLFRLSKRIIRYLKIPQVFTLILLIHYVKHSIKT